MLIKPSRLSIPPNYLECKIQFKLSGLILSQIALDYVKIKITLSMLLNFLEILLRKIFEIFLKNMEEFEK